MTLDVERRSEPIATGRTWRDIPPTPPVDGPPSAPLPIVPADALSPSKTHRWAGAAIGLLALAVGLALGLWAPWQDESAVDDLEGPLPSESAAPLPESGTTLPREIVPPPAEDPPQSVLPEDSFPFDGFPVLPELFGDDFDLAPRFRSAVPDTPNLIELSDLPDGYRIVGTSLRSSPGLVAEELTLRGPSGPVVVRAERSSGASLPDGQPHSIGDVAGVLVRSDPATFAYSAADDLTVTVELAEGGELDLLEAVVPSIEVVQ